MTENLYLVLDAQGVEHAGTTQSQWPADADMELPSSAIEDGGRHELLSPQALVERLGERIFVARSAEASEPSASSSELAMPDEGKVFVVEHAQIVAATRWDVERAAELAIDGAEHVLGDAGDAVLPGGMTLRQALQSARDVLNQSEVAGEHLLGRWARLSAARRLRRTGELLGTLAMEAIGELADEDIDALDDPAWTTIASARDAVLGAIEALRHLALPRYVEGREASYAERARQSDDVASIASPMWVTPWGPIVFGAEHQSAFAPPWLAARDALERARDAVGAASGEEARARELEWQTERLESLIL